MVLPLLAVASGIFSAIDAVSGLFDKGKEVYEQVTGSPSQAQDANGLKAELASATPEQTTAWVERMKTEVEQYRSETDRLKVDEGELTPEILQTIGPKAAAKVALERMTTRPRIAMRAFHVLATPMYMMWVDAARLVAKDLLAACGRTYTPDLLVVFFFKEGLYVKAYEAAAEWSAIIVVTYMTLRHFQKASQSGKSVGDQLGGLVSSVKNLFGRK
jgi:hypothetical protein